MHYIVDAFIAGFGFGVVAFVVVHMYTSAKLRKMHKETSQKEEQKDE